MDWWIELLMAFLSVYLSHACEITAESRSIPSLHACEITAESRSIPS